MKYLLPPGSVFEGGYQCCQECGQQLPRGVYRPHCINCSPYVKRLRANLLSGNQEDIPYNESEAA